MVDQGKKGYGNQKGKYGNQWQADAAKNGKQHKCKGKAMVYQRQHRTLQMSGSMNKAPIIEETALVGNQMQYTKDSSRVNKPNKFMGSHRLTKETRL